MFHIVLFEPEIPPNTGNIIRLCSNTGCQLHLIKPLGFSMTDKLLRRAGLDYHEFAQVSQHDSLSRCLQQLDSSRIFAMTTKASHNFFDAHFQPGDILLFGPETRGLPSDILQTLPPAQRLRLPMMPDSRSLNLSNSVAIAVYEAWRQCDFSCRP